MNKITFSQIERRDLGFKVEQIVENPNVSGLSFEKSNGSHLTYSIIDIK